jgi:hypothetical protein
MITPRDNKTLAGLTKPSPAHYQARRCWKKPADEPVAVLADDSFVVRLTLWDCKRSGFEIPIRLQACGIVNPGT